MVDDRILSRMRDDGVEHYALARRNRVSGNSAERMVRVTVGINGGEHSADDVECAGEIWTGIDDVKPNALSDFRDERMIVVLESHAVEDNFVRPDAHHLVVIARHECSF